MAAIYTGSYPTPLGELILGSYGDQLCLCDWRFRRMRHAVDRRIAEGLGAELIEGDSPVIAEAIAELEEYFRGERKAFDTPLLPVGSEFQKLVWEALLQIPYGETASYKEIAEEIGKPEAIRAVASANGANALSLFIPCHRIIGSAGELTGYAGGLNAKKRLLELESDGISQRELFEA